MKHFFIAITILSVGFDSSLYAGDKIVKLKLKDFACITPIDPSTFINTEKQRRLTYKPHKSNKKNFFIVTVPTIGTPVPIPIRNPFITYVFEAKILPSFQHPITRRRFDSCGAETEDQCEKVVINTNYFPKCGEINDTETAKKGLDITCYCVKQKENSKLFNCKPINAEVERPIHNEYTKSTGRCNQPSSKPEAGDDDKKGKAGRT